MPVWLLNAIIGPIVGPVINWLLAKIDLGVVELYEIISFYLRAKKITDGDDEQAKKVENVIARIRALKVQGLPVPPELDQELFRESAKINFGERFP